MPYISHFRQVPEAPLPLCERPSSFKFQGVSLLYVCCCAMWRDKKNPIFSFMNWNKTPGAFTSLCWPCFGVLGGIFGAAKVSALGNPFQFWEIHLPSLWAQLGGHRCFLESPKFPTCGQVSHLVSSDTPERQSQICTC